VLRFVAYQEGTAKGRRRKKQNRTPAPKKSEEKTRTVRRIPLAAGAGAMNFQTW